MEQDYRKDSKGRNKEVEGKGEIEGQKRV